MALSRAISLVFAACLVAAATTLLPPVGRAGGVGLIPASVEVDTLPPVGRVDKTEVQWRHLLTREQFRVLREHGTERPGSSPLDRVNTPGLFACAGCDNPLFDAGTKYDSGTGWPSFYEALPGRVSEHDDRSLGIQRTEVRCARCDGHLGHVFPDGPPPTGRRYCMNGVAMTFTPAESGDGASGTSASVPD